MLSFLSLFLGKFMGLKLVLLVITPKTRVTSGTTTTCAGGTFRCPSELAMTSSSRARCSAAARSRIPQSSLDLLLLLVISSNQCQGHLFWRRSCLPLSDPSVRPPGPRINTRWVAAGISLQCFQNNWLVKIYFWRVWYFGKHSRLSVNAMVFWL